MDKRLNHLIELNIVYSLTSLGKNGNCTILTSHKRFDTLITVLIAIRIDSCSTEKEGKHEAWELCAIWYHSAGQHESALCVITRQ